MRSSAYMSVWSALNKMHLTIDTEDSESNLTGRDLNQRRSSNEGRYSGGAGNIYKVVKTK